MDDTAKLKRSDLPQIGYTQSDRGELFLVSRGVPVVPGIVSITPLGPHHGQKLVFETQLSECPHIPWDTLISNGRAENAKKGK